MLLLVLLVALLAVVVAMIVLRRWTGRLTSLATLIAGAIMALWLAQVGLLPGSKGPLTADRPLIPGLDR
jgi:ABC-type branched-subunit amino acid transport system permease subunit